MFCRNILLLLLLFTTNLISQPIYNFNLSTDKEIPLARWSYCECDSIVWKNLDYPVSEREIINTSEIKEKKNGNYWLSAKIILSGTANEFDFLEIFLLNVSNAYEVYWDGKLVGSNGKVGKTEDDEILGNSYSRIKLKREFLSLGEHQITLRFSNHKNYIKSDIASIRFGYTSERNLTIQSNINQSILFIGGYSIAAFFTLMLFISNNRFKGYLFLLFSFLLILIFYLKEYILFLSPLPLVTYRDI
jgi:hypothetical protein